MSQTVIAIVTIAAPFVLAQLGLSADAWRRARQAEETTSDVEDKIDVILQSLGIDPDDAPRYDVEPIADGGSDDGAR